MTACSRGRSAYFIALGTLVGCYAPVYVGPAERAAVSAVLVDFKTQAELTEFMGDHPPRCLSLSPREKLCEWQSVKSEAGHRVLADSLGTPDRVQLICALPVDGSDRSANSCSGHPRRSTRSLWTVRENAGPRGEHRPTKKQFRARREQYRQLAAATLEQARTLVSLSRLVGELPEHCRALGEKTRLCVWNTDARTNGHGLLMSAAGATLQERVVLTCELPLSGSRAPASCEARIGSGSLK